MDKTLVRKSKFLSLVLRHDPGRFGLQLDPQGWLSVDALLAAAEKAGLELDYATLERIVAENDKQRFAWSDDGERIRARQGHSLTVDLGLEPITPPETLFHGTFSGAIEKIRAEGLKKGSRQYVHLTGDELTARRVGGRRGTPVILRVAAGQMQAEGFLFYRSENGVYLTEHVPVGYLRFD